LIKEQEGKNGDDEPDAIVSGGPNAYTAQRLTSLRSDHERGLTDHDAVDAVITMPRND
jgi:hypothetical protein